MIRTTQLCFALLFSLYSLETSLAFVFPTTPTIQSKSSTTTCLEMKQNSILGNALATSVLAAAVFVSAAPDEALAIMPDFAGSQQVIAARSGGRMGGRSYSGGSRMASPPSRSYSNTQTYSRTTVVRPAVSPTVIVAPTYYSPFGFNPFFPSPFGFGGGFGGAMRDYRQDGEIARERSELEDQRLKNVELEQRLAQLERGGQAQPLMLQSAPAPAAPLQVVQPQAPVAQPVVPVQ